MTFRAIVAVAACGLGPRSQPLSQQPLGVEVNLDDGSAFWLHEAPIESEHAGDVGNEWHVYRAEVSKSLDDADHLSRWPSWAEALEAIIEGREVSA